MSDTPAPISLGLNLNVDQADVGSRAFYQLFTQVDNFPFSTSFDKRAVESWDAAEDLLTGSDVGGELTVRHDGSYSSVRSYRCLRGTWVVVCRVRDGEWSVTVAAESQSLTERLSVMLKSLAGEQVLDDDSIEMSIWSESPMGGGYRRWASMQVGVWDDVMGNYPARTRASLMSLAEKIPDRTAGGIMVFGGPAGTGKTRAVEALCRSWAESATLGVVVDADRLFGSASYLTDVVTSCGTNQRQVIVVEDADEMVVLGPKSNETSKMLNIADGIVGRLSGAGTLIVLTANLALSEIAPYITRPGRSAAAIEFELFSVEEATQWVEDRGVTYDVTGEMSLAELYAVLRDTPL